MLIRAIPELTCFTASFVAIIIIMIIYCCHCKTVLTNNHSCCSFGLTADTVVIGKSPEMVETCYASCRPACTSSCIADEYALFTVQEIICGKVCCVSALPV